MDAGWVRNRVLWRAGKHHLLERRCEEFDFAAPDRKSHVLAEEFDGEPILLFWHAPDLWTLITTEEVLAIERGIRTKLGFEELPPVERWAVVGPDGEHDKINGNHLRLGSPDRRIWAPEGYEIHALWSILKMLAPRSRDS